MQYTQQDVKKLGRILGVWAHPDDESWASAGLMRMAVLNGQQVGIVTATRGDAGKTADENRWPQEKLAEIREQELKNCLCEIGDDVQQFWLDYQDGKMKDADVHKAAAAVQAVIEEFQPDTIVTFEHYGITGHDDHQAIHLWARHAIDKMDRDIRMLCAIETVESYEQGGKKLDEIHDIFFNTDKPRLIAEKEADVLLPLPDDIVTCKLRCLQAHACQTSHLFAHPEVKKSLENMSRTECFIAD